MSKDENVLIVEVESEDREEIYQINRIEEEKII